MGYFITTNEIKNSNLLNANVDNEYIDPAINEAEDIFLREILGDTLYNSMVAKVEDETIEGDYLTMLNTYIKPFVKYKAITMLVIPIQYKIRNAGVISQSDSGYQGSNVQDTKYMQSYYDGKAEFYANRLTTYLLENENKFTELKCTCVNVTEPHYDGNVSSIYLGGMRAKQKSVLKLK